LLIFYGVFVRFLPFTGYDPISAFRWAAFQDIEVMLVVGFGLLMAFVRSYSITVLIYTLFMNALLIQIYPLFNDLAARMVNDVWSGDDIFGKVNISTYTLLGCCGCVAAQLIAYCAVLGRIGPKDLLIMSHFCTLGYCFNEVLVLSKIKAYDAAGSLYIHVYGAVFGLATSYILGRKKKPVKSIQSSYNSLIFATVGTIALWVYWPSFNFGGSAKNEYEQFVYAYSTLIGLVGSCMMTFVVTSLLSKKITMEDILNATLSGGVSVGVVSAVSYYPYISLLVGMISGVISTLGFHHLTPYLQLKFGLHDSCGIVNLHFTPGAFGGIVSALVVWSYSNGYDNLYTDYFGSDNPWTRGDFSSQGWRQLGGLFCSIGFGLVMGLLCGLVMAIFYDERTDGFFDDREYLNLEQTGACQAGESQVLLEDQ
jgi:ammonium transporter Rh